MKLDNLTNEAFHEQLLAATRRANQERNDIPDPAEFAKFMDVLEELGAVAKRAEKEKVDPLLVGRAMQYYSRCIAVAFVKKSIVPEAAPS